MFDQSHNPSQINPFILPPETDGRYTLLQLIAYAGTFGIGSNLGRFLANTIPWLQGEAFADLRDVCGLLVGLCLMIALFLGVRASTPKVPQQTITDFQFQPRETLVVDQLNHELVQNTEQHVLAIAASIPELQVRPNVLWRHDGMADVQLDGLAFGDTRRLFVGLYYSLCHALHIPSGRDRFYDVVLHELGHLANQDVGKTVVARETFRWFRALTSVMVVLLIIGAILHGVWKESVQAGLTLLWAIGIQLVVVYLIVHVTFRSILRIREYYADARARIWMGRAILVQIRQPPPSHQRSLTGTYIQRAVAWCEHWLNRITPTHPTAKQRQTTLARPQLLFGVSTELACLSGLLVGLALNTAFQFVALLHSLGRVGDQSGIGLMITSFADLIAVGLIPLAGLLPLSLSLGQQIQRAALTDASNTTSIRTQLRAFIWPALLTGSGIVVGAAIAPTPNSLSLWGWSLLMAPVYALGWSIPLLAWMVSLFIMTRHLVRSSNTSAIFLRRRQPLMWALLICTTPILVMVALSQSISSTLIAFPEMWLSFGQSERDLFPLLLIGLWFVSLMITAVSMGTVFMLTKRRGWIDTPPARINQQHDATTITNWVGQTQDLCDWLRVPQPLVLPQVPAWQAPALTNGPPSL